MNQPPVSSGKLGDWVAAHLPFIFRLLRFFKPVLVIKGFGIVTRFDHVQEVLNENGAFHVPYTEKMGKVTNGSNFFLGMQPTAIYERDVSNMRLAMPRGDAAGRIKSLIDDVVTHLFTPLAPQGKMDFVQDLSRIASSRAMGTYMGVPGPDGHESEWIDWNTGLFGYLFADITNDPKVEKKALEMAVKARAYIDFAIQTAGQSADAEPEEETVIDRCLSLQKAGFPGMDNASIRNNLIGMTIGAIPTTSKAVAQILDYMLDHPSILAGAGEAALQDDDDLLRRYCFETLRFNAFNPGVFRIAVEDYVVARGSWRATRVKKGTTLLAATQSAMLDGRRIPSPSQFRLDRPDYQYMLFGYGLHTCFGQFINAMQIPAILKPVLKLKNLRRAPGEAGKIVLESIFPIHLNIEWDV